LNRAKNRIKTVPIFWGIKLRLRQKNGALLVFGRLIFILKTELKERNMGRKKGISGRSREEINAMPQERFEAHLRWQEKRAMKGEQRWEKRLIFDDSPRGHFLRKNIGWIQLLKNRQKISRSQKKISYIFVYTHDEAGPIEGIGPTEISNIQEKKININKSTETLEKWQTENAIFHKDTLLFKYKTEKELILAAADWMFENLKAMTRGESSNFFDVPSFGIKEANALLNQIWFDVTGIKFSLKDNKAFKKVGVLSSIGWLTGRVSDFVDYASTFWKLEKIGKKGFSGAGFFKVAVCPYHRLHEPECGRVSIRFGRGPSGDACPAHARKQTFKKAKKKRMESLQKKEKEPQILK
jgi:hypothetical protein